MNRQSLAARRAEREEILRKFASEEEHVEASGSVKHSNEMNQYPGEMKYPTMKLEGENSMKGENPDFAKTKVPTKNPKNLQLKDSMDAVGFEGSEGTSEDFEFEVDWDQMDGVVPTTGEAKLKGFEIPSEMDLQARKTTVAYKEAEEDHEAEVKHAYKCEECGTKKHMTEREAMNATCETCAGKKEVEAAADKATMQNLVNETKTQVEEAKEVTELSPFASVDTARIKAAYSCATKLALAGIINSNETDDYAGQLLEDGLRADVMIKNTQLLLRSAQASAERVAAAAAEKLNVRTASTMGISTSPALSGGSNSAALDIQSALRGLWTTPQIEDQFPHKLFQENIKMAIRALNSVIVANYNCAATASWQAGACLMINSSGLVVKADRSDTSFDSLVEQTGKFVGFSSDDTARTGNTMILADPVGSNYIDGSGVFQSNNNGFYVASKRAIGDFQSEIVNGVTNLSAQSSGYEGPRRGVGVYNTPGGQFVTDQYVEDLTTTVSADGGSYTTFAPGDLLVPGSGANAGKLVKLDASAYGTDGIVVGRVDSFDSAAGLLYFTQILGK